MVDKAQQRRAPREYVHYPVSDMPGVNLQLSAIADAIREVIASGGAAQPGGELGDVYISDVIGLQTALDGKASQLHGHEIADVSGLRAELDVLGSNPAQAYATVADACAADLEAGALIRTLGRTATDDGGGAFYVVGTGAADGYSDHAMANGRTLVLTHGDTMARAEIFGVLPGGGDVSDALDAAHSWAQSRGVGLEFGAGSYYITRKHDISTPAFVGVEKTSSNFGDEFATIFVVVGDHDGLRFSGEFCRVGDFAVHSEHVGDSSVGVAFWNFKYGYAANVLAKGFRSGFRFETLNAGDSWTSTFSQLYAWGCLRAIDTDYKSLIGLTLRDTHFMGLPQAHAPWIWGQDTNTVHGFYWDSAEITDSTSETDVAALKFIGGTWEGLSGHGLHIKTTAATAAGHDLHFAQFRQLEVQGIYAPRCRRVAYLDMQNKGGMLGALITGIIYTNDGAGYEENAIELLGSSTTTTFGGFVGCKFESPTIITNWGRGVNWHKGKIEIAGIGLSTSNADNIFGDVQEVGLVVNNGEPLSAENWGMYRDIRPERPISLGKYKQIRILEMGFVFDRDITAAGTNAARGWNPSGDLFQTVRTSYSGEDTADTATMHALFAMHGGTPQTATFTYGVTTASNGTDTISIRFHAGAKIRGYDDIHNTDRVITWPASVRIRTEAALNALQPKIAGYMRYELIADA